MRFPSTRRSVVFAARSEDAGERRQGFEALVAAYWKPVYKFIRLKWGCSAADAEDLTQGFFARAIEKQFFRGYEAEKGSFRTYLRTCLEGYISNERKSAARLKRGGDSQLLSLDFASAEGELREHPPAPASTLVFSHSLLPFAPVANRGQVFKDTSSIQYDLEPEDNASYATLARDMGLPVTTVTNQLAWARREFRRLLLERLREVTGGENEFRSDAKLLLGGGPL